MFLDTPLPTKQAINSIVHSSWANLIWPQVKSQVPKPDTHFQVSVKSIVQNF
jgi:hypothetical protein